MLKASRRQIGGNSYCKGICNRYKSPKPTVNNFVKSDDSVWGKDPYETHSYCRVCGGIWMKKEDTIKSRCPCCNFLTANKSRKSKSVGSKKKVYYRA
jgi:ribosomal protein L37E